MKNITRFPIAPEAVEQEPAVIVGRMTGLRTVDTTRNLAIVRFTVEVSSATPGETTKITCEAKRGLALALRASNVEASERVLLTGYFAPDGIMHAKHFGFDLAPVRSPRPLTTTPKGN